MTLREKICILFTVAALTLLLFKPFDCSKPEARKEEAPQEPVRIEWINRSGDSVVSLKSTAAAFAKREKQLLDSIARIYKVKPKQVKEYVNVLAETQTDLKPSGPVEVIGREEESVSDPINISLRQSFSSPYYDADVLIGDSSYLKLKGYDTLTLVWKEVKEGKLFDRKSYMQLDLSNANKDTRITGVQAYRVPGPRPRRWAIGLVVGYGLVPTASFKPEPFAGIGITRTMIRF